MSIFFPKKLTFLKECFEKENKYKKLYETSMPPPKATKRYLTPKFYSIYEAGQLDESFPEGRKELLRKLKASTPRERYEYPPPTTAMNYGWFNDPLIPRTWDSRLYFPVKKIKYD